MVPTSVALCLDTHHHEKERKTVSQLYKTTFFF